MVHLIHASCFGMAACFIRSVTEWSTSFFGAEPLTVPSTSISLKRSTSGTLALGQVLIHSASNLPRGDERGLWQPQLVPRWEATCTFTMCKCFAYSKLGLPLLDLWIPGELGYRITLEARPWAAVVDCIPYLWAVVAWWKSKGLESYVAALFR